MPLEVKCGNCKHEQSRNICGNPQSPHFKEKVEPDGKCDLFLESPARGYFKEACLKSLADESSISGMEDFKRAIDLGLPEDEELFARYCLATQYVDLAVASKDQMSAEQLVKSSNFLEALNQAEKAILIDRQGQYQYFADPLNRARLRPIDEFYDLAGAVLKDTEGIDSAIEYLQQKIGLLSYLASTPLLLSTLLLGDLFVEKGQKESAAVCYRNIVNSEPVLRGDETRNEPAIREEADEKLRQTDPSRAPAGKSGCFVVTAACGSEFAEEVILLRAFRDGFLARRVSGRAFIRAYNTCGPFLARIISRSNILRNLARTLLVKPAVKFVKSILPEGNG
jgi:hypothetical protein